MSFCAECDRDDISLSCRDPRSPPLDIGLCLCPSCGYEAYVEVTQALYDDMCDELGHIKADKILGDLVR